MGYPWLFRSKFLIFIPLIMALVIAVACGDDATPTSPAATATPTTESVTPTDMPSPTDTPEPTAMTPKDTPEPTAMTPKDTPEPTAMTPKDTPAPTATPEPVDTGLLVSPDANPKKGGTFVQGGLSGVALFDMHQCSSGACTFPLSMFYNGLVRFDPFKQGMSSVIGELATSWEVSSDNLEYTFHLREGVKFHDGTDFSADDIVATYKRIVDPPEGVISIRFALFEAVENVEKIDSKTVKFTLREPRGLFLSSLALGWNVIYSAKQLADNNQNLKAVKIPTGTGPFKFVDYKVGEKWTADANDNYWSPDLPYVDGAVTQELGHGPPTGQAFIAGHLDFGNSIGGPDIKAVIDKNSDQTFQNYLHPGFCGWWFNVDHAPWGDARMRRAVHWGVSKPALQEGISHIRFLAPEGWITHADPRSAAYWNTGTPLGDGTPTKDRIGWREPTADDISKANALIADTLGHNDGLKDVQMVDRALVWSNTFSPIAQGLLKQELNIATNLETHPRTLLFEKFAKGEFDIGVQCTSMTLALLEDYWGLAFWSQGPQNWSKWNSPEFDKIYFDILKLSAGKEKNDLINKGMAILDEEVPMYVAWGPVNSQAWKLDVKGHRRGLAASSYEPFRWEAVWLDR